MSLTDEVSKTSHLYAVGSVITAGLQDCTIWGSGILYTLLGYRLRNRLLDIRAVRGPLTRVVLLEYGYDVPEIYGDPAIFLPEVYSPNRTEKKFKYGVVAHKNGASRLKNVHDILGDNYLDIDIKTNDYKAFVDQLVSVERVISTSLHGIILAESYGIPAILVRPDYSLFKYYDYYLGTNRGSFPILEKLPSKEELDKMYFPELPDTEIIGKRLEEAFPYDLFY
ncbi:MAG: polysaccharide pyruvyl transferase family protein [Lachnospiraceae bacterium]|nr:polysaccharide pyruvyl transferase family protein [Lachnospiraceae bacterium]